jgi:hypothetical protein
MGRQLMAFLRSGRNESHMPLQRVVFETTLHHHLTKGV